MDMIIHREQFSRTTARDTPVTIMLSVQSLIVISANKY